MSAYTILQFRQDLEAQFRKQIREALDAALKEELTAVLASDKHERTERRRRYRNGSIERTITTPEGTRTVTVLRGRIAGRDEATQEFHSQVLPRYARRTREIGDAIPGCYLGGINSRRIRTALKPLLGERHPSKSAVSRIVGRLKALFTNWQEHDLSAERYPIVFLDGLHLKVRVARRLRAGARGARRCRTRPEMFAGSARGCFGGGGHVGWSDHQSPAVRTRGPALTVTIWDG